MNGPTFTSPRSKTKKANTPVAGADPDLPEEMERATNAVIHLTSQERAARGKAARAEVPRSSHAGWDATSSRPDPVGLLQEQAKSRVLTVLASTPEAEVLRENSSTNTP